MAQPVTSFARKQPRADPAIDGLREELRAAGFRQEAAALRVFEVVVHNREVRACLKNNREHPYFNDRWADGQHSLVAAADEIALARILKTMYPWAQGFVIDSICERPVPAHTDYPQ
ncbi:MAG: hypothetical protein EP335_18000 [Alphaproteobacteria bacterium]|nr:MAG: hypothetical protein EP335_18000 [Alphaproteobacteria bacterium]